MVKLTGRVLLRSLILLLVIFFVDLFLPDARYLQHDSPEFEGASRTLISQMLSRTRAPWRSVLEAARAPHPLTSILDLRRPGMMTPPRPLEVRLARLQMEPPVVISPHPHHFLKIPSSEDRDLPQAIL
ncbi:MAG: hypothetical protein HYV08_03565 [Deltaproteobacteria bacterium]|nr:hypothetical protein [Deltaproteobacteria bacterium]MBI3079353.1 hypothetical protein [Deltaproteobacteria bacterium]